MASNKSVSAPAAPESKYPIKELAENYAVFEASYEIVHTALKLDGKEEYTVSEARKIVDNFKKEVR